MAREYGYIATAKFDRRNPMPYGCILRCMSIFFKQILTELPSEVDRFANMLKEQLGPIAQLPILLLDNVPEIRTLLSEAKDTRLSAECDIGGSEIKMRFHSAFIEIFQVMVRYRFVTLVSNLISIVIIVKVLSKRKQLINFVWYIYFNHVTYNKKKVSGRSSSSG